MNQHASSAVGASEIVFPLNFIGGQWCEGIDRRVFAVSNPVDQQLIVTVPDSGASDARAAVDAAHAAFAGWKATPARERAQALKRWHALILQQQDSLGELISQEQGKPLAEGRGEVLYAASGVVQTRVTLCPSFSAAS